MIKIEKDVSPRIQQGDIYKEVEYIEKIEIIKDEIKITKIVFPLVIVLTQDCDLEQDSVYWLDGKEKPSSDDKKLLSVIVAPLYNEDLFLLGDHLSDETLKRKMQVINKKKSGKFTTQYKNLTDNDIPRYHYLEFPREIQIVNQVIDFKHYFCVDISNLMSNKADKFVCKVTELYRERISQRFANFLSRIGLPTQ